MIEFAEEKCKCHNGFSTMARIYELHSPNFASSEPHLFSEQKEFMSGKGFPSNGVWS